MISGEPCDKPRQREVEAEGELVSGSLAQSLFYLYLGVGGDSVGRNRKSTGVLGKCYS